MYGLQQRLRTSKILIVGLGNLNMMETRHSVGMQVVDWMASKINAKWSSNKQLKALVAKQKLIVSSGTTTVPIDCYLLKSKIPMNGSGISVRKAAHLFSINTGEIFLICDELDKATGKFALKESGSARGHNGVRSVFNCLSTQNIARLMMGIDRPTSKSAVESYVLSDFSPAQKEKLDSVMVEACTTLLQLIEQKLELDPLELVKYFRGDNESHLDQDLQIDRLTDGPSVPNWSLNHANPSSRYDLEDTDEDGEKDDNACKDVYRTKSSKDKLRQERLHSCNDSDDSRGL